MQAVFDYLGYHRGNLGDLVPIWLWILPFQDLPALTAGFRCEIIAVFDLLYGGQLPSCSLVTGLSPSLALALASLAGLGGSIWPVTGRRLGGVARASVDSLTQSRYLCLQFLHVSDQRQHKLLNRWGSLCPLVFRKDLWLWLCFLDHFATVSHLYLNIVRGTLEIA